MPCRSCRGRGSLVRAIRQHGEGSSEPLRFFPFFALRVRQSSRLQSAVMATNLIPYGDGCPRAESPSRTDRAALTSAIALCTAAVAAPGHVQEGPSSAAPIGQLVGRSAVGSSFGQRQLSLRQPRSSFCQPQPAPTVHYQEGNAAFCDVSRLNFLIVE